MDRHDLKQKIIASWSRIPAAKNFFDWYHKRRMAPARALLQSDGLQVCHSVCKVLSDKGIAAFPAFGSLLGLVREGSFLKHDDDIDIGVIMDESFSWTEVKNALESIGLTSFREFGFDGTVTEQAYRFKNCLGVDIFLFIPASDYECEVYFYTYITDAQGSHIIVKGQRIPKPKECKQLEYQEYLIPIPDCSEKMLRCTYGPGWQTPDPNWQSGATHRRLEADDIFVNYFA